MAKNIFWEHMESYPIRKKWDGWDEEYSSVDEFKQHLTADLLSSEKYFLAWVFWTEYSPGHESNSVEISQIFRSSITENITHVLRKIASKWWRPNNFIFQFWAREEIGGRCCLTTLHQPFAVSRLAKGVSWVRKKCMQHYYYIADEDQQGPPERVFRNGNPESSPNILFYSTKEFPLRDHVTGCGLKSYLAFPIFDVHANQCAGVLEFIYEHGVQHLLNSWSPVVSGALQEVGLRSAHKFPRQLDEHEIEWTVLSQDSFVETITTATTGMNEHKDFFDELGQKQAFSEIKEMLTLVVESPQLQTASVWTPCNHCVHNNIEISCMERAQFSGTKSYDFSCDPRIREFIEASKFHQPQITNGIIGKVIESESKLYFCEDLCSSSIREQPLAHYVQAARLEICFAICLKSSYTGSSLYVIEFFLFPHSTKYEYSRTLCSLLSMMKQKLKSFKVASGRRLGPELILKVKELCHEMEHHLSNQLTMKKFGGQCNLPLGFENVQYGHEIEQQHSENQIPCSGIDDAIIIDQEQERNSDDAINVEDEAQNIVDVSFEDGTERDRSSTSFHVSYDQLKSQFGKSRKDAADNLGVSISTFKRICRYHSVKRWPSRMNNIKNPSLFLTKVANKCVENADHQTSKPSGCDLTASDYTVEPNISSSPIQKTTELANTCQAADVVIKAKFEDETLKFEFCVSRGLEKLMEEVGKRLNLKIAEFKLKYADDDDDDLISLTCDEDLHFYVKTMKSIGKRTVQVFVHLISE